MKNSNHDEHSYIPRQSPRGEGPNFDHAQHSPPPESLIEEVKNFFGVGPKGYQRSDARILEEACEALSRDAAVDASQIEVTIKEGKITLRGEVSSRWMKQRADDCVHQLHGVREVDNELEVMKERSIIQGESVVSEESLSHAEKSHERLS